MKARETDRGSKTHYEKFEKGAQDELKGKSGGASAESEETQLALQDTERDLSRTLNERDAMAKALYEARKFLGKRKRELEQLVDVLANENGLLTANGKAKR